VLAAAVLLGIGIAGAMGALASMTTIETRITESEKVNRLAAEKMQEVLAVGAVDTAATDGNFEDYGEPNYTWKLDVAPSGTENLNTIQITVEKTGGVPNTPSAKLSSLWFKAPAATTGAN
jgi:hypothetical protein